MLDFHQYPMTLAEFERWTTYLSGAVDAVLLVQLLRYGLARRYGWLFGYLLVDALQVVLLVRVSLNSAQYGYIYFGGQSLKAVLGTAFAIKLWNLSLLGYPALARCGRRIVSYMLLAAMAAAAAGLLLEPAMPPGRSQSTPMHWLLAMDGAVDSMVLVFLVAAVLFLLWFPVKVRRNVALCVGVFAFYMFQGWALFLLLNLYPRSSETLNAAILALPVASVVVWIAGMRPEGEIVTTITGHRWNLAESERLIGQLDAINARLERIAK